MAAAACGGKKGWIQGVGLTIRSSQTRIYGTWSGCLLQGLRMISQAVRTVLKSKVPSAGQPTLKLGHSALQKITIRDFFNFYTQIMSSSSNFFEMVSY